MTSRPARLVRAALAAGLTTFVAALSHSLAGASAPGSLAVVLSLAFSLLVCIALTGKALSVSRMSAAVVSGQFAYHGLFTLFGGTSAWAGSAVTFAEHHHVAAAAHALPALSSPSTMASMAVHDGLWMPVTHAFAALITIAALHHGECVFWELIHDAHVLARALFTPIPVLPIYERARIRVPNARNAAFRPELHTLISPMRHRGPPKPTPIW